MKTYTAVLAANQMLPMVVPGEYFHLITAPYAVDVDLLSASMVPVGERATAIEAGTWIKQVFGSVVITNGANAQTIKFAISAGEAGVFRVAGDVSVIDGAKNRTIAGQAFLVSQGSGPVAGQVSHVQLFMPVAATVRAVITKINGSTSAAGAQIQALEYSTALATLTGNAPSKLIGAAASVAEFRQESNAAALGTGGMHLQEYVAALTQPPWLELREPIVLRPGKGFVIRGNAVNSSVIGTFEFFEEPNL